MRVQVAIALFSGVLACGSAAAGPPMKASPELLAKGKTVYSTNCMTCHGEKGDGSGPAGAVMNPKPRDFSKASFKKGGNPQQLFETISKGLEGTSMPGFAYLSEEDRWALAHYVRAFKK